MSCIIQSRFFNDQKFLKTSISPHALILDQSVSPLFSAHSQNIRSPPLFSPRKRPVLCSLLFWLSDQPKIHFHSKNRINIILHIHCSSTKKISVSVCQFGEIHGKINLGDAKVESPSPFKFRPRLFATASHRDLSDQNDINWGSRASLQQCATFGGREWISNI